MGGKETSLMKYGREEFGGYGGREEGEITFETNKVILDRISPTSYHKQIT